MRRVLRDTLATRGVLPAALLLLLCWRGVTAGASVAGNDEKGLLSAENEPELKPVDELLLQRPGPLLQQLRPPELHPSC
jgi:hypothetical protein